MKVLLVSHDAGGAEILSAWYRKHQDQLDIKCCLQGPAFTIFQREHNNFTVVELNEMASFSGEDWVLTGTSLESDLERQAIKKAKEKGFHCVSFLDHWDLYTQRFQQLDNGQFVLPEELWVGDEFAYQKAVDSGFDSTNIVLKNNPYFEYIQEQYSAATETRYGILYICETIGRKHEESEGLQHSFDDEFTILNNLLSGLAKAGFAESMMIRLHPREERNKYDEIISKYKNDVDLRLSEGSSLIEDIQGAKVVVGMESMGLIVAMLLGKKVFSYRTGKNWPLTLPFPEIICTDSAQDIACAVTQ